MLKFSKTKFYLLSLLCAGLFLASCGDSAKPVAITDLKTYTDDLLKFSIQYPSNWQATTSQGQRVTVFSSNDAKSRFLDYAPTGFPGAMIDLQATKADSTKDEAAIIEGAKRFQIEYKQSNVTVDGAQGKRFDYAFPLEDGEFHGAFVIASKDNVTYTILKLETFADSWEGYENDFNKIISSVKLAVTQSKTQDTITNTEELPFPTENLVPKKGNGFTISIPDNFYAGKASSANTLAAYNFIGDRRGDCNITVDVLDGSKTSDLKKAAGELASKYPGSPSVSGAKIGGTDGFMMNWSPRSDVRGRVYFAKKGDKIFRIAINWFVPEQANYLPIFEKSINSIKFD